MPLDVDPVLGEPAAVRNGRDHRLCVVVIVSLPEPLYRMRATAASVSVVPEKRSSARETGSSQRLAPGSVTSPPRRARTATPCSPRGIERVRPGRAGGERALEALRASGAGSRPGFPGSQRSHAPVHDVEPPVRRAARGRARAGSTARARGPARRARRAPPPIATAPPIEKPTSMRRAVGGIDVPPRRPRCTTGARASSSSGSGPRRTRSRETRCAGAARATRSSRSTCRGRGRQCRRSRGQPPCDASSLRTRASAPVARVNVRTAD